MELLQLRYFLTVARTLNITRAAEHHQIPQPAMSKTISKLEKELGTPLFDRYRNKLTLTEAGKEFYRSVSLSLGELDRVRQEMTNADLPLRGELRLLVQQHRSTVLDSIVAFKKLYPDVHFRMDYEQEKKGLGNYDLCISHAQPEEQYDQSVCLITEQLKLVVSSEHVLAKAGTVQFQELKEETFAAISRSTNLWQQTLLQCRQAGFEPNLSMICGDIYCLIKYVGSGMAVTLGPELSWQGLKNDRVTFLPTQPEVHRTTYVFWNGGQAESRLRSAYREFLISYFSENIK